MRLYFDYFGQVKYLKTKLEWEMGKDVIQRNTDLVQPIITHVCGHLCLFVLTYLTRKHQSYQVMLNQLIDGSHKVIGKFPRTKSGFVLPYHKYTGPHNPLREPLGGYDRPLAGQEQYNAVDAISKRHDICYRDNETKGGGGGGGGEVCVCVGGGGGGRKHACDDEMLQELDVLEPKGIREKERQEGDTYG